MAREKPFSGPFSPCSDTLLETFGVVPKFLECIAQLLNLLHANQLRVYLFVIVNGECYAGCRAFFIISNICGVDRRYLVVFTWRKRKEKIRTKERIDTGSVSRSYFESSDHRDEGSYFRFRGLQVLAFTMITFTEFRHSENLPSLDFMIFVTKVCHRFQNYG